MYIARTSEQFLAEWRVSEPRKPLIIRGARQTGKSRLVEEFGEKNYDHLLLLNIEKDPSLKAMFDKPDVKDITRELEVIKDVPVTEGRTLIFIDEIQECPQAITKLRYFYEDMPKLHVIAAGSLLEFVLEREELSFPVGRVDFHYLFPLTFEEFLGGHGKSRLIGILKEAGTKEGIPPTIHEELRRLLKSYLLVGGMPEAVASFIQTGQYRRSEIIKESITETYRDDFKKYSRRFNIASLDFVFREAPKWMGRKLNLRAISSDEIRPREASTAISLLERAMILHPVRRVQAAEFPLLAHRKTQPKLVFLDVGLAQHANRISQEILQSENYQSIYRGGLAEQLAGQELLATSDRHIRSELFYWHREETGALAEVDYLFPYKSHLIPIEVKAGRGTTLFSLHQFMARYHPPLAIRIYDGPLKIDELKISAPNITYRLLSVPLYMISEIMRLSEESIDDLR